MSHDEHTHPETILPGCKVLMLDEAHSGSTDIELILARILPRISQVENFRLVLMSATLNIDTFVRRVTMQVFLGQMSESFIWMRELTHWPCTVYPKTC